MPHNHQKNILIAESFRTASLGCLLKEHLVELCGLLVQRLIHTAVTLHLLYNFLAKERFSGAILRAFPLVVHQLCRSCPGKTQELIAAGQLDTMTAQAEYACIVRDVERQDDSKTIDIQDWLAVNIRRSEMEVRYQNVSVVLGCGQRAWLGTPAQWVSIPYRLPLYHFYPYNAL